MPMPKAMRLKGHRTFEYIYKNSVTYYGKFMNFKIVKSNPQILISHKINYKISNFKMAIAVSKKVSKKSVIRNKIRRLLQNEFLKNFRNEDNHKPYWLLVNLKVGNFSNDQEKLLKEFHYLIIKSGLFK